jgi:hypothetical protein
VSSSFTQLFGYAGDDDGGQTEPRAGRPVTFRPRWYPPEDELGAAVPLGIVVGRSEEAVVALSHVLVHSTGLRFPFLARARGLTRRTVQRLMQEHDRQPFPEDLSDAVLRLGLELPDGARVSSLGHSPPWGRGPGDEPEGPLFFAHGGRGGSGGEDSVTLQDSYWLWPLPPPGPIRVFCEWPAVGIPLTRAEIDGAAIAQAAARVTPLWP